MIVIKPTTLKGHITPNPEGIIGSSGFGRSRISRLSLIQPQLLWVAQTPSHKVTTQGAPLIKLTRKALISIPGPGPTY